MTRDPLVTVCIFTRNRQPFLRLALEAALRQTFADLEVLVIDNASTDGTAAMVGTFLDPRLVYHRNAFNRMAPASYCLALRKARGRFILLSHDDDVMGPDLVSRQVAAFREIPGLLAVTTNVSVINERGAPLAERRSLETRDRIWPKGAYIHAWNTEHLWLPFPTLMIRRPLVRSLFRPRTWESVGCLADIYTMARLNQHGPIAFLADPLLAYRQHAQQAQFRYDSVTAPTLLHARLVRMTARPGLRHYTPMGLILLLKYRLQRVVLGAREPPGAFLRLRKRVQARFQEHSRRMEGALRNLRRDLPTPETEPWLRELARNTWGPQLAICGLLVGAGEPVSCVWDMTVDSPFHHWLRRLRAGGSLCHALGHKRIAIMGSLLNAALIALDAVRSGMEVVHFLDSNQLRNGGTLFRIPIREPQWLKDHWREVEAVIVSSENGDGGPVIRMLEAHLPEGCGLPIISWKSLLP
ncbi:MAG: glycosyltransferase [Holophaga sp.]|nr:glycosyltransferase [Holophaga sp.]